MWLKKFFSPYAGTNSVQPTQQNAEKQEKKFQQEDNPMVSTIIFDVEPDNRYKRFKQIPHNSQIKIPMIQVHPTQNILMHQTNLFQAKISESEQWQQVNVMMTDRQIVISPNILYPLGRKTLNYCTVNYGSMQKSQIVFMKKKQPMRLKITLKTNKQIHFRCVVGDLVVRFDQILDQFAFVKGINKFYAYRYGQLNKQKQKQFKGWKIYDIKREFFRQGLILQGQGAVNLKYISNQNQQLSPTYPQFLVVPSRITDYELRKCAQFRTKDRFPALTYIMQYKNNKYCGLFRCSQNKVGVLYARSKEDQLMIQYIGQINSQPLSEGANTKNCKIYDARGYYAALGNMFAGKGFQKPQFYKNCQIQWLNIPNIHAVRQSYYIIMNYKKSQDNFLAVCAQSGWYDYLYLIIAGAKSIAKDLLQGVNVVVHCSDGWDRTSQLCAISQIMLDPFYRTIQGFGVLIEKDWRNFGHKFRQRVGQYCPKENHPYQQSPIFIQFLDCVYQIMEQFPLSFEFSERLLYFLAKNVDSNVYGNFMTNNVKQFKQLKLQQKTISIWSDILENTAIFKNPFYQPDLGQYELNVGVEPKNITIWRSWFISQGQGSNNTYQIMRFQIQRRNTLKAKYYNNFKEIEQLTLKLSALP